jgi:hypothetical protein
VLGTGEYMSLDQLKEINNAGMGIMNHTGLHCTMAERVNQNGERVYLPNTKNTVLEPCPSFTFGGSLSVGQVEYELKTAKEFLDKELGIDVRSVVYPFGNYTILKHQILCLKLVIILHSQPNPQLLQLAHKLHSSNYHDLQLVDNKPQNQEGFLLG